MELKILLLVRSRKLDFLIFTHVHHLVQTLSLLAQRRKHPPKHGFGQKDYVKAPKLCEMYILGET